MTAVFPARYRALRDLLPGSDYVPARLAPGLGAIVLTCLEYRDTDIGPYDEVLIGVMLSHPSVRANPPGRMLVDELRGRPGHAFVWHLPMATTIALRGGIDFHNLPKFLASIEFADADAGAGGRWRCRLAEGAEHILTLSGDHILTPHEQRVELFAHSWMDGEPQCARVRRHDLQAGKTRRRSAASLELGERHPIARALDRVLVSRQPLSYELIPRTELILFGPERLSSRLVQRVLAANEAFEHREPARA